MPSFALEFEVYCSCGEGLCHQSSSRESRNRGMPQVVVEPCQKCLDDVRQELIDEMESYRQEVRQLSQELTALEASL